MIATPKATCMEYMLSKIATTGQNGQFRAPRHTSGGRPAKWWALGLSLGG